MAIVEGDQSFSNGLNPLKHVSFTYIELPEEAAFFHRYERVGIVLAPHHVLLVVGQIFLCPELDIPMLCDVEHSLMIVAAELKSIFVILLPLLLLPFLLFT